MLKRRPDRFAKGEGTNVFRQEIAASFRSSAILTLAFSRFEISAAGSPEEHLTRSATA
jgi:hypothetical protein